MAEATNFGSLQRSTEMSAARRSARIVGVLASIALAGVLLFSTWAKGLDPHGFADQMVRDGMLSEGLAFPAAVAIVALEAGLAFGLLFARRFLVLAGSTLMMGGFFGLALYQYLYPPTDPSSCGCFGNLVLQSPGQHLFVNSLFVVLALMAWLAWDRRRDVSKARWVIPAVGLVLGGALSLAAPSLPVDNLATQLKPGVEVGTLRVDEVLPEIQVGTHLVLLIDRADEQTRQDIARVNQVLAMAPDSEAQVFGLAEENEQLAMEFFWTAGPAFDVRGAPWSLLKPLYRTLPRSFLVEDGEVTHVWSRIPSEETLQQIAEGRLP
jgi:hypothetical protein